MSVQVANPSDIATLAPNIVVFVVAVIASVAGVYQALRNLRKSENSNDSNKGPSHLQAGVILDNVSITLWSESNRQVAESNRALMRCCDSLKQSNYAVRDELRELGHQIERMRDQLNRS